MAVVTKIPATKNKFTSVPVSQTHKRRVAAYARVSTDKDEQITSYNAQVDYYKKYIQNNPDWEYVDMYADEGITGTSTKSRKRFNEMIDDAVAGKIDLIITKSVSRFARNTVDTLVNIRKLKDAGVECFFEEQGIWTFDSTGELMITMLSSIAQEEARNISENVTWGHRRRFEDGKIMMSYKHFLGYERGEDGVPVINPEEAKIVRDIYEMFMQGKTPYVIARTLEKTGVLTPMKKKHWSDSTIVNILTNEKYKGDALLQKKFTVDFLTKKTVVNEGQLPMYHAEGTHEPIITMEQFEAVQRRLSRQADKHAHPGVTPKRYPFSGKIACSVCGKKYRRKVTATGPVWICSTYNNKGKQYCASKQIPEDTLCRMTAAVLHMRTFDAGAFQDRVKSIDAEPGNTLRFHLFDGTESVVRWQDKSRRDSWTPEMKEKAREKYYGSCNQNTGDEEQIHIGADVANA